MSKGLKVLFVSAEVAPYAKTGGLADVAGSLPKELLKKGIDARIVMPKYKMIQEKLGYVTDFPVHIGDKIETCVLKEKKEKINKKTNKEIQIYFTDNYNYFDRDGIYCYYDDAERYIFFCKAVLEMLPKIDFKPDIIHCNDWHSGLICLLLKEKYKKLDFYKKIATIFTIHNLRYQGHFSKKVLGLIGIGEEIFTPDKIEFYGIVNFMKAGIVYGDIINTVSKIYAKEIQTEHYGEKLEGLLRNRKKDLYGIVNGISYDDFDPKTDKLIYKNYDLDTYYLKKENKYELQRKMGLPVGDIAIIGHISRLTSQKGINLIIKQIDNMLKENIQFIILGTGDIQYEEAFTKIKEKYPKKVGIFLGFNTKLAHTIYAGSDMFLMPSHFEPCGLGQIISLRYGTIPIVRKTGGLAETVSDYNKDKAKGNGFVFEEFKSSEMFKAIKRALDIYNNNPKIWQTLVKKALSSDYSWNVPAKKYIELYEKAVNKNV